MRTRRQAQKQAIPETRVEEKKLTKAELLKRKKQAQVQKDKKKALEKVAIQKKKSNKSVAKNNKSKDVKVASPKQKKTTKAQKQQKAQKSVQKSKAIGKAKKAQEEKKISPQKKPSPQKKQAKQETKQVVKTMILKGKIPIDQYFPLAKQQYHVLQYQGKIYSATLNQTNVLDNNNKFYIIQILQNDSNPNCYFFTRWGRVGSKGSNSCQGPWSIIMAVSQYNGKFHQKNKKGDYREIELNYEDQSKEQQKKELPKNNQPQVQIQSKLSKPVQNLIQLIFDINMMNRQMVQIGYNVDKMPLGKLSKENIKKGYGILKDLYQEIKKKSNNQNAKISNKVIELTNDFYSFIPHDFGYSKMSSHILDTEKKVKQKIEMLEALAEIKVATTLLSEKKGDMNKIDGNYQKLNRKIESVDKLSSEFKAIKDYLQTTHGRHHTNYSMEIVDLFKLENEKQTVRYTNDIHNKMLLWHGSRLTNFVGILSQGLRIAPPQAPVTGYMFGKGVYFADMSSKSANYCFTSRQNPTGILLLCEVALGNMNEKTHADYYASNLPPNKHSTKGVGKIQPDPKNEVEIQKGVVIPMGPSVESTDPSVYLRYNEFIVYDIAQIKVKYLLRTKFVYV